MLSPGRQMSGFKVSTFSLRWRKDHFSSRTPYVSRRSEGLPGKRAVSILVDSAPGQLADFTREDHPVSDRREPPDLPGVV